jgi:hypothetical protein
LFDLALTLYCDLPTPAIMAVIVANIQYINVMTFRARQLVKCCKDKCGEESLSRWYVKP